MKRKLVLALVICALMVSLSAPAWEQYAGSAAYAQPADANPAGANPANANPVNLNPANTESASAEPAGTQPQLSVIFENDGFFTYLDGTKSDLSGLLKVDEESITSAPGFYISLAGSDETHRWKWSSGGRGGSVTIGEAGENYVAFDEAMRKTNAGITYFITWDRIPQKVQDKIKSGQNVTVAISASDGWDDVGPLDIERLFPIGEDNLEWEDDLVFVEAERLRIRLPIKFNFERTDQDDPASGIVTLQEASKTFWGSSYDENGLKQTGNSMPIPLFGYGRLTVGIGDNVTGDSLESRFIHVFSGSDRKTPDPPYPPLSTDPIVPWWIGHFRMCLEEVDNAERENVILDPAFTDDIVHIVGSRHYYGKQIKIGGKYGGFYNTQSMGAGFIYPVSISFYIEEADNLSASSETVVSSARRGELIGLKFNARSTFLDSVEPEYAITINGAIAERGRLSIPPEGAETVDFTFPMPASDAAVAFTVNPRGDDPEEENLTDNSVEMVISEAGATGIRGDITLEYNVLEQTASFELGAMTARLPLPRYADAEWTGDATGYITVTNETPELYHDFRVNGESGDEITIDISTRMETISRTPTIRATIIRDYDNYRDDPLGEVYGANFVHNTLSPARTGVITAEGSVSRPFSYTVRVRITEYDEELGRNVRRWSYETEYGTVTASFNSVTNSRSIVVEVYNGKTPLNPPWAPIDRIDDNTAASRSRHMWWESESIPLAVLRPMGDRKPNFRQRNPPPVTGQFARNFTNQNEAEIGWALAFAPGGRPLSMANEYKADRDNAKARNYDAGSADKAVFASDVSYSSVPWPVRSGYFFNPAGTYTFHITTQIYSGEPYTDDEGEHAQLVEAVIGAFRYESNMVYIDPSRQAVTIGGARANKTGTAYAATPGYATVANSPLFDIDVSTDYSLVSAEELRHDYTESGTDPRLKRALEGYEESGTRASMDRYKYIEFVEGGESVYQITETTTVTITVNPGNQRVYTHPQLRNGDYTVRASFANINLGTLGSLGHNGGIGAMRLLGVSNLDSINIRVVGSLYDDAR